MINSKTQSKSITGDQVSLQMMSRQRTWCLSVLRKIEMQRRFVHKFALHD